MTKELEFDLNHSLTRVVPGNKYLRKVVDNVNFLRYDGNKNHITANLDLISEDYCRKFIEPNFITYCTGLLPLIKRRLDFFIENHKIPDYSFTIQFEYKMEKFICQVFYHGKG